MFMKDDNTYDKIRERSIQQWLEEMSHHSDIAVRGGVKVTSDYIEDLKKKIVMLEEKNQLKDKFLRQMKENKKRESQ